MPISSTPVSEKDMREKEKSGPKSAEAKGKSEKEEKAPETVFIPEEPKYDFDDMILPEAVKDRLLDAADYAKNSVIVYETWGLGKTHKQSRGLGINLYGAPGTGKTMAAHAIAKYLGRKILVVNYADIESKYVGETPKNIRKAFEAAKESNSIIFFDEADAILSKRVTNMTSATDVSVNQTRSVMLMLMNDYQDFIIFATNFIQNFDAAFMRRIAKHVEFTLPDLECRKKLWRRYIPFEMPNDVDIDEIAGKFEEVSGSDISTAVLNAAFKAARLHETVVLKKYFFEAIEDIVKSRDTNRGYSIETRQVSKEYVKDQLGYLPETKDKEKSGKDARHEDGKSDKKTKQRKSSSFRRVDGKKRALGKMRMSPHPKRR